MEPRVCKKCAASKPLIAEFFRPHGHAPGFRWTCRECEQKEQVRRYYENPEKYCEISRKYGRANRTERNAARRANRKQNTEREIAVRRRYLYGITPAEYERTLTEQKGLCVICQRQTKLCVDHCHKSGRVRGLLCKPCNSYLGTINESEEALMRAIQFVQR